MRYRKENNDKLYEKTVREIDKVFLRQIIKQNIIKSCIDTKSNLVYSFLRGEKLCNSITFRKNEKLYADVLPFLQKLYPELKTCLLRLIILDTALTICREDYRQKFRLRFQRNLRGVIDFFMRHLNIETNLYPDYRIFIDENDNINAVLKKKDIDFRSCIPTYKLSIENRMKKQKLSKEAIFFKDINFLRKTEFLFPKGLNETLYSGFKIVGKI